jgi:acyl carrier protein
MISEAVRRQRRTQAMDRLPENRSPRRLIFGGRMHVSACVVRSGNAQDNVSRPPEGSFMSSVQDTIFDIIANESGIDRAKITPDATLKDLEIQSLDAVQILFEIEDRFKITMPDRDPNFDTESVKGLVETVEKLVAEPSPAPPAA